MTAAAQLPLLPTIREPTVPTRASELDEQARAYLDANPGFWRLFVRFADEAHEAGRRISSKAIVERIRWEAMISLRGEPWRCNNNHTACFARIYQATYPERAHVFETRERKSAERRARG